MNELPIKQIERKSREKQNTEDKKYLWNKNIWEEVFGMAARNMLFEKIKLKGFRNVIARKTANSSMRAWW